VKGRLQRTQITNRNEIQRQKKLKTPRRHWDRETKTTVQQRNDMNADRSSVRVIEGTQNSTNKTNGRTNVRKRHGRRPSRVKNKRRLSDILFFALFRLRGRENAVIRLKKRVRAANRKT